MPPGIRGRKSYNGDFFEVRPTLVSSAIFSSVSLMVRALPVSRQRHVPLHPSPLVQLLSRARDALGQTADRDEHLRFNCAHRWRHVWTVSLAGRSSFLRFALARRACPPIGEDQWHWRIDRSIKWVVSLNRSLEIFGTWLVIAVGWLRGLVLDVGSRLWSSCGTLSLRQIFWLLEVIILITSDVKG